MNAPRSILVVEDNPDDEALTLRALSKIKLANQIVVKRDGAEALAYLLPEDGSEPAELPQVVLLDLKLPKISGFEVLRRLREHERTRYLPVVVLTSSNQDEDRIRSYACSANSFVQKPVDFKEFIEAVSELGLYWAVINKTV